MPVMDRLSGPAQFVDWMARRRFSQKDAAEYLGWPEPVISKLVNGKEKIGLDRAIKLERLTGIPVEVWASALATGVTGDPGNSRKSKVAK